MAGNAFMSTRVHSLRYLIITSPPAALVPRILVLSRFYTFKASVTLLQSMIGLEAYLSLCFITSLAGLPTIAMI